jgi:hypothetical protein
MVTPYLLQHDPLHFSLQTLALPSSLQFSSALGQRAAGSGAISEGAGRPSRMSAASVSSCADVWSSWWRLTAAATPIYESTPSAEAPCAVIRCRSPALESPVALGTSGSSGFQVKANSPLVVHVRPAAEVKVLPFGRTSWLLLRVLQPHLVR